MGLNTKAHIGYGFVIDDETLITKIMDQDEEDLPKGIEIVDTGYCDGPTYLTVCITKSVKTIYDFDKPKSVKLDKWFVTNPEWNSILTEYSKTLGIKNPKCDWFITSSIS